LDVAEILLLSASYLIPWRQNPKVYHRVHKIPPPIPLLSQVNPLQTLTVSPEIHFDPNLPYTPRSFEWSLFFGLSHLNLVYLSFLSHACRMPRPPHSPWFQLLNDLWGISISYEALSCAIFPFSRSVIPLKSIYSPQHPVLKHPQSALPFIGETKFHTDTKQLADL
jgi:hypothetical protein